MFLLCRSYGFLWLCRWCLPPYHEPCLSCLVLYSPAHDLVSSGGVCIGLATNNIIEYESVKGILTEAASQDIRDLVVFMDSQLVVFHLNQVYTIINPILLRLYQRVFLLERSFKLITYRNIPRADNEVVNSLANYILDWYIAHL